MNRTRAHGSAGCMLALAAATLASLTACADRADDIVAHVPAWSVPFTVRGRWDLPHELTYLCDAEGGGIAPDVFVATIERALAVWSRTGLVGFRPARDGEQPTFVFSWARGAHAGCRAFGMDFSVAHTGPVVHGTFVHFDAGHRWSVDGDTGESLLQVASHEIGHVLGLDHSPDPGSLMSPDARVSEPTSSDLAGLHSLYGGGVEDPGDLGLFALNGTDGSPQRVAATLRRSAPPERTDFTLFDADGDGSAELIVWRTDPEGIGALTMYHFDLGPVLARTVGPLLGVVPAGASPSFRIGSDGRRWIVLRHADGTISVRRFDENGWLTMPPPDEVGNAPSGGGVTSGNAPSARFPYASSIATGDLDGDGRTEFVVRRSSGSDASVR